MVTLRLPDVGWIDRTCETLKETARANGNFIRMRPTVVDEAQTVITLATADCRDTRHLLHAARARPLQIGA